MREDVIVIGGGLAGSEAAWQAATRGARVTLYEMRPKEPTQAHKTGLLAELVCSNSLGSGDLLNAPGILKEEMRRLNSLVVRVADEVRVPAGTALAVDRDQFAQRITQTLESHANVRIIREEIKEIPTDCVCIIATGPLTSDGMATAIRNLTHSKNLYFFDAISPIIDTDSIKMEAVFRASRYDKGGADYLNCPMDEAAYDAFHDALLKAEKVQPKEFEKTPYFEGCIPIEVMAERGRQTMLYGPLKPVGLEDPRTRTRPHAVVQLRAENLHGSCYNMVGFQTKLTYPEQRRVFRMIPGLEQAEFLRYGSLHRNTFVNSPELLRDTLQLKARGTAFFAGQLVGVEGYTESAAMGGLAGINAARGLAGLPLVTPPPATAHGSLISYITTCEPRHFQPINTNFGLFPPLPTRIRDKDQKRRLIGQRALEDLEAWKTRFALS
ncbi:MAG: methylenetetrahydrofolate--tRNA-(uracil(54)-C(5))-methyltransferase (FADH(2)-oxidizing) TrmFO [Nitrospiraceae bacterium]